MEIVFWVNIILSVCLFFATLSILIEISSSRKLRKKIKEDEIDNQMLAEKIKELSSQFLIMSNDLRRLTDENKQLNKAVTSLSVEVEKLQQQIKSTEFTE